MSIIIMILLLSFLVLVHEAGHFFAARALGIKVSKFGFGLPIGPTLWSKKVGDVEVVVHAFLLGGYVSFPDDEKDSKEQVAPEDRFMNKPVWQRMVVISAGVIANIITAFFLVFITALVWGQLPSGNYEVFVDNILKEKDYPAQFSNLQKNDKIIRINGSDINSPYALTFYAKNSIPNDGKITEQDFEKTLIVLKKLNPQIKENELIAKGTEIKLPESKDETALKLEDKVLKGYKLYKDTRIVLSQEQIKLRDTLKNKSTYISDGKCTPEDIAKALTDTKQPLNIVVLRNQKEIKITPVYPNKEGFVGVVPSTKEVLMPTKNIPNAVLGTGKYLWTQTYILVYGLWQLFTGKIPVKDLHGIVVITKIGGDVIQNSGFFSGVLLTAMISLDLALVNFLPIPALDGGHFMFLLIEKLRGKPVNEETLNKISSFFFILLIIFMILVVFNDIYALVKHKF